jgi:hypothetical protein
VICITWCRSKLTLVRHCRCTYSGRGAYLLADDDCVEQDDAEDEDDGDRFSLCSESTAVEHSEWMFVDANEWNDAYVRRMDGSAARPDDVL